MAKYRVPCATCEGGFHEVDEAELKKFTESIHNPTHPLERIVEREVSRADPELATKIKDYEMKVRDLETKLAEKDRELPVDRMIDNWEKVSKHLDECLYCKPLFNEKIFPAEAEKRGYIPKPKEPEPPKKPDKASWVKEQMEVRHARGGLSRRAIEAEYDEKFREKVK